MMMVPLPANVRAKLDENTHPGLMLDKFAKSWDPDFRGGGGLSERVQKPALEAVVQRSQNPPPELDFTSLLQRRAVLLRALDARVFRAKTIGPLTLHLARASALENAGICLHPIYGFTLLVGSGLKGMARAYAETAAHASPQQIASVFGDTETAGAVVFHDAWPTCWPKLAVDILNNHHAKYYQGEDAPGDWENPVPVYFLAVHPKTAFEFALSKRRSDTPDAVVELAHQWLLGALCHLGAGAKTNAGYGTFQPVEGSKPVLASPRHATFEATLELVTPAFLAGANQQAADCDLRPASLRGLLRWWWRTMHAGLLPTESLQALEGDLWGNTSKGGAVRVTIEPIGRPEPRPYDKNAYANMRPEQKASAYGISGADPRKTTQGLWYASYGMDERRQRRWFLPPGSQWRIRLVARDVAGMASSHAILHQAKAALWLLCAAGGVGSKSRKGFGSLKTTELDDWSLDGCLRSAEEFRQSLPRLRASRQPQPESASLTHALPVVTVQFPWPNIWDVLDQVGFAYQAFAKKYRHRLEKKALGLPRRIGPPVAGRFAPQVAARGRSGAMSNRNDERNERHASPIHLHVDKVGQDGYAVSVLAFPAARLPDWETSRAFLGEFLAFFHDELSDRARLAPPARMPPTSPTPPRAATVPPQPGPQADRISVTVVSRNEKLQDAYFVQEFGKRRGELRFGKRPASQPPPEIGDVLQVYRHNNDPNSPQYRWDPPPPAGPRRPPGRGGPQRRR